MSTRQRYARIRVCASCEWVFKSRPSTPCPKCKFATYGARWVYGPVCYRYLISQTPWKNRKMKDYESKLLDEIRSEQDILFKRTREVGELLSDTR